MLPYIAAEVARGTPLSNITRHMLGLFHGSPGARRWRQILTVGARRPGAGVAVVEEALAAVAPKPWSLDFPRERPQTEIPARAVA
jgi:tRNA-dihydrouridine synthase A